MQKNKNLLTDKQFQILRHTNIDTWRTQDWIAEQGLNANTFGSTHIRLLQAQQQAHTLLTHYSTLLKPSQRTTLENFRQRMAHQRTRDRLKPTAANPVLNISCKINRQLFKQHRQLTQA